MRAEMSTGPSKPSKFSGSLISRLFFGTFFLTGPFIILHFANRLIAPPLSQKQESGRALGPTGVANASISPKSTSANPKPDYLTR